MAGRYGWTALILGVLVTAVRPVPAAAQPTELPKIAIVDFEAAPGGWTLPPAGIGATVAQLMLDRLVEASRFHVFDGQWLHGAATPRTRASEAVLLADAREAGVDYLVLGSITQFSMEQRQRTLVGGGLLHGLPLGGGGTRRSSQLAISILVRVLNVRTGEVVTTTTGIGDGVRKHVAAGALVAMLPVAGGFSSGSSNTRDAQLGEATRQAVDAASAGLVNAAPRLAASRFAVAEPAARPESR